MSGEKVGSITVVPGLLFGALGLLAGTAVMATGAAAVVTGAAAMAAGGAARGAVSAYGDHARTRRASREAERARREREALQRAQSRLSEVSDAFEALKARATEIEEAYDGIELPGPPQFPEVDQKDAGAILASLTEAEAVVTAYRNGIGEALAEFHRNLAAGEGRDEVLEWYGSFATERGAGSRLDRANNERLLGARAQDKELRRKLFEDARELMAQVEREVVDVSEELQLQLGVVLSAGSHSEALVAKARLKQLAEGEIERVRKKREQRQREQDDLLVDRMDRVAELMAMSLADMGYAVSGIEESAYVQDGQIIAHSTDHSDHALRLTIDRESKQVTSNVIRLADPAAVEGAYDPTEEERDEDRAADEHWCRREGVGRFRDKLKKLGIEVNFRPTDSSPGVEYVSRDDLSEASPTLKEALRPAEDDTIARTHDVE